MWKAPDTDGIQIEVLEKFWNEFGLEISTKVKRILSDDEETKGVNYTDIELITKRSAPKTQPILTNRSMQCNI